MYRIYDNNTGQWRDDIIVLPDGAFAICKKTLFGNYKMNVLWNDEQFILHFDTGIYDKNDNVIFEGDICKDKDGNEYVVGYSKETGNYCLFSYDNNLFYILVDKVGNDVEVVGNVFDNVVSNDADS